MLSGKYSPVYSVPNQPLTTCHATVNLNLRAKCSTSTGCVSGNFNHTYTNSYSEISSWIDTLMYHRCSVLPTVVSIELGSLEMVCSLYLKSHWPREALCESFNLKLSPIMFVQMCLCVKVLVRLAGVYMYRICGMKSEGIQTFWRHLENIIAMHGLPTMKLIAVYVNNSYILQFWMLAEVCLLRLLF